MAGKIAIETAQRIAAAWDVSTSLADAMQRAGLRTKDPRAWHRYRRQTEDLLGIKLPPHHAERSSDCNTPRDTIRIDRDKPYTVAIFSDWHCWPGQQHAAYWILLKVLEDLKPDLLINNGDSLDGADISRHPPLGWEGKPTLIEEIRNLQDTIGRIEDAAGKAERYWNMGNHDHRLELFLARQAQQLEGLPFTTLEHFFPKWRFGWSVMLNDTVYVKHRWHGGIHAAYNNTLRSGKTIVTGHTHRLSCVPWTDLNGTRYGIETGMLNHPYGPQFDYCEDNPRNWQPGFIVLTVDGKDVHPERVEVKDGRAFFRGRYYRG